MSEFVQENPLFIVTHNNAYININIHTCKICASSRLWTLAGYNPMSIVTEISNDKF
jgi:hypothetical protein